MWMEMVNGVLVGYYMVCAVWIESYQFDATVIRKIWHSERRRRVIITKLFTFNWMVKLVAKSNNSKPASKEQKCKRINYYWAWYFSHFDVLLSLSASPLFSSLIRSLSNRILSGNIWRINQLHTQTHRDRERETNGHTRTHIVCEA